jgi:tetratricopeptide (TPR) repeat protein
MNKLSQRDSQLGRVPTSSTKSVGNLAVYEECLAIRRRLAKVDPHNAQWQHDEACLLDQIGDEYRNAGMKRQAIGAYEASLAVLRHLAEIDPRNTQRQLDVAISFNKLGDVKLDGFDSWGAITCYQASLAIWRQLCRREPNNACWHSNIAQNLEKMGDIRFAAGDSRGALTAYEEMLEVDRELVEIDGTNIEWQLNLSSSLERTGDARLALDNAISAVAAYEESVAIRRRLIELGSNSQWTDEVCIIKKIDQAKRAHEEQRVIDNQQDEVEAPPSLSGDEVIARTKNLLFSFFTLVKAIRTQWRKKPLLLNKLTKRATALVRSFQRASLVRNSLPQELRVQEHVTASHKNESSIQGHVDGVSAIALLSSDSVSNTDDAKASSQASIKKRRRRRRHRKRKGQHKYMQHSPPGKKGASPISKH